MGILSQIERNVTSPSLKTLTKSRIGLGVPLSALFEDEADSSHAPSYPNVRRKAAHMDLGEGILKQLVSPASATNLQVMMLVVQPNGSTGDTVVGVPGEKAAVVLTGSLEITIGTKVIHLEEGDAGQFDAETPHAFRNSGAGETQIIWIISQIRRRDTSDRAVGTAAHAPQADAER